MTKAIYRRVPVLIKEGPPEENLWGIRFATMFHMANDSYLFRTREQLEQEGWRLKGNIFVRGGEIYLPLYEAKMIDPFNHRAATYAGGRVQDVSADMLEDPSFFVTPRYWVPLDEVKNRLQGLWSGGWLLGWQDVTDVNTMARTVIASVLPRVAVGHTAPLMLLPDDFAPLGALLAANLSSFVYDFAARFKVGGTHLTFFIIEQLPVLPPATYDRPCPWSSAELLCDWLSPRVLELTYTGFDLEPFAEDLGYQGPPFRWDEERRFCLRCELDAAFFHLYGIEREDVDYIMDTFPIVKRKDEERFGGYRTKRVILGVYEAMAMAMRTGRPYQTIVSPGPADSAVAHARTPVK